jgi:hypothetical protein
MSCPALLTPGSIRGNPEPVSDGKMYTQLHDLLLTDTDWLQRRKWQDDLRTSQYSVTECEMNFFLHCRFVCYSVTLELFMAMTIQVAIFWVVMLCSDLVGYQHFLKMEAAWSSKMLVSYITTQHHNPEDHGMNLVYCSVNSYNFYHLTVLVTQQHTMGILSLYILLQFTNS